MKKYISLLLAVLLLFSLSACGGDKEEVTTTLPYIETTTAPSVIDLEQTTASSENPTYILTTKYGETVPTVVTTRFDLANEITTVVTEPLTTAPDLSFTVPSMSAPEVLSEQISSTVPGTLNIPGQTGGSSGENTPADETTKPADERERKNLEFNSSSFNSSGNLELCFDSAGWNSIKSGKVSGITVSYEGKTQTVEGYVKQGSDGGVVTVYTKDLSIPSDTVVTCTIPAGVVVSSNNSQYNMSYTFSTSTGADAADYE